MGLGMIKATFLLWLLHCGLSHFLSKKGREREDKGACVAQGPLAPPLELSPSFILSLSDIPPLPLATIQNGSRSQRTY